ncbi:MAG: glutamate-1-semialdehyde 2,1-aminomutase [Cardiobacteriaceae bacterium]|nr:glutamate-1-semialdehyde 2,1-aminomutase [Cardiobacteriaceae bacterium]
MHQSEQAFSRAQNVIVGGVNSPVRAFKSVGGVPRFLKSALGAKVWDVDGHEYIDYVGSWGPAIVGHAHPEIVRAVQEAAVLGLSFGAPCEQESALAEMMIERVPSLELVRFCSSGTEATMSAIRLARGFTGRTDFVKFSGCYHGHSDGLLVDAGSGALTFGVPSSQGVPQAYAQHTLNAPYNDLEALKALFAAKGKDIAAVIVEPVAGNMNCVLPKAGFLQGLRDLCDAYGAVLIFDEVMTGFRVARGGAQELYGIKPDLSTFGKVIGGGMPVGAFGGRREIMQCLAPLGGVYQAGTLSGNPVAMAAGIANLKLTQSALFYSDLAEKTHYLAEGLRMAAARAGVPFVVNEVCGMLGLYFTEEEKVEDLAAVKRCDAKRFAQFFHAMLDLGVYLAPSAFEAIFIGAQHDKALLDETIAAAEQAFRGLA